MKTLTRGPWVAHRFPYGETVVVTNPPANDSERFTGQVIACKTTCPDWSANAKLIAAAPELLALAERIARLNPSAGEIGAGMLAQLVAEAQHAIAKVTL